MADESNKDLNYSLAVMDTISVLDLKFCPKIIPDFVTKILFLSTFCFDLFIKLYFQLSSYCDDWMEIF